ncbi:MAG: 50S ribosomal protein L3 [Nanoarchaeota archaeon]|nr:50S ribosomal protein L3 [Nanoarchaeota archaeon]
MTNNSGSHKGSLQFYPRVRAKKVIPSVNWKAVKKKEAGLLLGFIGYKAGMVSVLVKDSTDDSMTKNKKIIVPATIIECPAMKIYSVRFYKNGKVSKDLVVSKDKELKKNVKIAKELKPFMEEDFDDVRVIVYSGVKNTSIGKKKSDMIEIGLSGSRDEKIKFIREKIGKEILINDVFRGGVVDVRAVTKGYGTQGPVRRFGIHLKNHKTEKGVRRPGSLAPWHPARVTFRTAQAGQTGFHNRIVYNNVILEVGKIKDKDVNKKGGLNHYGFIKTDYLILKGSVPGPQKRGVVITPSIKSSKKQSKKKLEVLELRW